MTIVESVRQALGGMQNVEREIIERLRERGAHVDAKNFSWNHGRSLAELPSSIHLEVRVGSRRANAELPRIFLEDSWDRIDRWEVRQQIERVLDELAPAAPAT